MSNKFASVCAYILIIIMLVAIAYQADIISDMDDDYKNLSDKYEIVLDEIEELKLDNALLESGNKILIAKYEELVASIQ